MDKKKFNDYDGFVDKFKLKKTTDDCNTPPEVYDVVLQHVETPTASTRARPSFAHSIPEATTNTTIIRKVVWLLIIYLSLSSLKFLITIRLVTSVSFCLCRS